CHLGSRLTISIFTSPPFVFSSFFFYCSGHHRHLHSFPTRRSSDLPRAQSLLLFSIHYYLHGVWVMSTPCCCMKLWNCCRVSGVRSEEHTSELLSRGHLVCRLLLEKKKKKNKR